MAFSRDQLNKIYVQDLIKVKLDDFIEMIVDLKVHILVCGNGKNSMSKNVKDTFIEIISSYYKSSVDNNKKLAENLIKKMQNLGLYQEEIW